MGMVVSANLKQLPPEIVGMICAMLPTHNVAALELSCSTLKEKMDRSNVWQKKAFALHLPEESFVLGMLKFARANQISKSSAYKVILGTQQLIESTIFDFNRILFTWRCLQPEYQAINGGVSCKNPGSYETITEIDLEYLLRREKFFQRIFLATSGPIDVPYSLHKIELLGNSGTRGRSHFSLRVPRQWPT